MRAALVMMCVAVATGCTPNTCPGTCDANKTCVLDYDQPCENPAHVCMSGSMCLPSPAGRTCQENAMNNSSCDATNCPFPDTCSWVNSTFSVCMPAMDNSTQNSTTCSASSQCDSPTVCYNGMCTMDLDSRCEPQGIPCGFEAVCTPAAPGAKDFFCKAKLVVDPCDMCAQGTACDSNRVCVPVNNCDSCLANEKCVGGVCVAASDKVVCAQMRCPFKCEDLPSGGKCLSECDACDTASGKFRCDPITNMKCERTECADCKNGTICDFTTFACVAAPCNCSSGFRCTAAGCEMMTCQDTGCPDDQKCKKNSFGMFTCMGEMDKPIESCSDMNCTADMDCFSQVGLGAQCIPKYNFDCTKGGIWSDMKAKHCDAVAPKLNCSVPASGVAKQNRDCCAASNMQGNTNWCDLPQHDCDATMTVTGQAWCCDNFDVSCGAPDVFDCSDMSDMTTWTKDMAHFCCKEYDVGCDSAMDKFGDVFECEPASFLPWVPEQQEWCCANKNVSCKSEEEKNDDRFLDTCMMNIDTMEAKTKAKCCDKFFIGCAATTKENCSDVSNAKNWGDAKRTWCCLEQDKGCQFRCIDDAVMTMNQSDFCCDMKGYGCSDEKIKQWNKTDEDVKEKMKDKPKKNFRCNIVGDDADVKLNPKKLLRRFRMALLKGSKTLRTDPASLIVTLIGILNTVAGANQSNWQNPIPQTWNVDLHADERTFMTDPMNTWFTDSRTAAALEEAAATGNLYADYTITNDNAATVDAIGTEVDTSIASGDLSSNNNGYTTAVASSTEVAGGSTPGSTAGSGSSSDDDGLQVWVYIVIAAIGAMCVGLVAFFAVKKTGSSEQGAVRFEECAMMEDVDHFDNSNQNNPVL